MRYMSAEDCDEIQIYISANVADIAIAEVRRLCNTL